DGAWSVPSWIPIVAGATVIVLVFALCIFGDKKSEKSECDDKGDNYQDVRNHKKDMSKNQTKD
ncbi:hypothetical protein Bpfe_024333, partial [Biomphalaria pfeifferi]